MRWHAFILSAFAITGNAIFADEAYTIDFHQALLGQPQPHSTFFHKPDLSSNAALLYTLSDRAVLGAVTPRDGSLLWRQAIAGTPRDNATESYLVAGEGDRKLTTAFERRVDAWDASSGRQVWTYEIEGSSKAAGLQAVPVLGSSTDGAVQDVILLTQPQKEGKGFVISRLGGDGAGMRWHYSDPDTKSGASVSIATSTRHVFYVIRSTGIVAGQRTKVTVLDITTGKHVKDYFVSLDADSVSSTGLVAGSCSPQPFLITSEKPYKTLKLNLLGNTKVTTITLEDKSEDILSVKVHAACGTKSSPHFLVHVQTATRHWAEVYHLNAASGEATRAYSLPATKEASAFAVSSNGEKVFFTRVTSTEVAVYSSESHGQLGRWTRRQLGLSHVYSDQPILATAEVATGTNPNVRVAVTSPEGSWYLIRNGDTQWSRPEMLAYANAAAWSEDIQADALAQELETEISVDPATAYINRVYRHATELRHLPGYLMELPQKLLSAASTDEISARNDLVGSKSLILATKQNRLFSVSGTSGKVQWQADLSSVIKSDIRSITAQEGRCTLYTSQGSVLVLNATTGTLLDNKSGSIPVDHLVELPGSPASTIVKVDEDGVPEYASDLAPSVPTEGNTLMTLSKSGEQVMGWTVGTSITKTWTFTPEDNARVISIGSRPVHDPIASIGRVLGDRSVLYKYFTPNLATLATISSSNVLTIYLVDAVTGSVLHTSRHPGVLTRAPISTVISENWFAYTFTSSDPSNGAISPQLIVSELYESSIPNDRGLLSTKTNYSSFGPDGNTRPHVISAAFTLSEPISDLAVTQTAQGITIRQLLAYAPKSNAIAAIPRHLLDARRPVGRDPNAAEAEEGLFRYQPQLDLDPKSFLTHSREVLGIKQISTTPTLLESTSLVFAYGHDIFGTQVAPSQTFDVLGKSFKKIQLIGTVVALYLGVLAIRPLVRRKVVERGWL